MRVGCGIASFIWLMGLWRWGDFDDTRRFSAQSSRIEDSPTRGPYRIHDGSIHKSAHAFRDNDFVSKLLDLISKITAQYDTDHSPHLPTKGISQLGALAIGRHGIDKMYVITIGH